MAQEFDTQHPRLLEGVRGGTAASFVGTEAVIDRLVTDEATSAEIGRAFFNYYLDPHPERAPAALVDCIEKGMFHDPDNVVWYLFARIARGNPWLVRRYEDVLREHPAGRVAVLKILQQSGDDETRRLLLELTGDPHFEPLQAELQAAVQRWPAVSLNPLACPVNSPADLDLLWCEFRATGSTEPVLRVIDIFERPDRVRRKLERWLYETPPKGPSRLLWTLLRKRISRKLREEASIVCDLDRLEVRNLEDLDCHCVMQDMALNPERSRKVARLLPFELHGEDGYVWFKAAARWSLASHAREHRVVFDVCESEAFRRTGRCRDLLLGIVGQGCRY